MQRLRGRLYCEDGAIERSELSSDGRHVLASDDLSWHLLTVNDENEVLGCTRYLQHSRNTSFHQLRIGESALAECNFWGSRLRGAIEEELSVARAAGLSYVEVGGWAIDRQIRRTAECLRSVLATYAWSRLVGGAIGICTATERNGSASILGRLGGRPLEWDGAAIPPYFDPYYNCRMQILRFDSRIPHLRYEPAIDQLAVALSDVPVICPERSAWQTLIQGFSSSEPSPAPVAAMAATA